MTCEMCGNCELQDLAYEYSIKQTPFVGEQHHYGLDERDPFIQRDLEKCILCRRCVRACSEIQVIDAIGIVNRGFRSKVATAFDTRLQDSVCVFCGQCVSVCPTGALTGKQWARKGRYEGVREVDTVCAYCGTGCILTTHVKGNEIIRVSSKPWSPNEGWLCVKGRFGYKFVNSPDRLTKPLIRRASGEFEETSWTAALEYTAAWFKKIREKHGADAIGGLSSARCTNEENYLFQKFIRAGVGTNNVDHCARL
jgi:predicted molibdopterin-dependent oxidoreductase YjgC